MLVSLKIEIVSLTDNFMRNSMIVDAKVDDFFVEHKENLENATTESENSLSRTGGYRRYSYKALYESKRLSGRYKYVSDFSKSLFYFSKSFF